MTQIETLIHMATIRTKYNGISFSTIGISNVNIFDKIILYWWCHHIHIIDKYNMVSNNWEYNKNNWMGLYYLTTIIIIVIIIVIIIYVSYLVLIMYYGIWIRYAHISYCIVNVIQYLASLVSMEYIN